jgi:hypothetical protein
MPRRKKQAGTGALVSCKTRFLHPSALFRADGPTTFAHETINLVMVGIAEKNVRRKVQNCYILHHDKFKNDDGSFKEIYAVCRNCRIEQEGPAEGFFVDEVEAVVAEDATVVDADVHPVFGADVVEFRQGDDIAVLLRHGIDVDDDNEPAPENVVIIADNNNNDVTYEEWGFRGLCERRKEQFFKTEAKLRNYNNNFDLQSLFEHFFPTQWVKEVLIKQTNNNLKGSPLTYGEFLKWYGLWLVMATVEGSHRREFWSTGNVSMFSGAPYRLGEYMPRSRFEEILTALSYTTTKPTNDDKFWEVREMITSWNDNMAKAFSPSYISCLDESMSPWTNPFSCQGYIYVPRKPHPFGNEYHSVACGLSRIMWAIELVEGKDGPHGAKKFDERGGKTVGLLLRMTATHWYSGMCLVLDSGFCVLKALIELRKVGIYAASVIKKRRYWPKYIDGDNIIAHFADKDIGSFDVLPGKLDNIPFGVFCMKEPDYTMMLMATYGTNETTNDSNTERTTINNNGEREVKRFQYTELFYNHFKFRNAVDAHNQQRHQPISLEEVWATMRWPNRVFSFLLSITEVNVKLASEHFGNAQKQSMLAFRKQLASALINNRWLEQERTGRTVMRLRPVLRAHELMTVPQFKRWNGAKFTKGKVQFYQRRCECCSRKIRTYCACNPGKGMCHRCYPIHLLEMHTADPHGA